MNADLSKWVPEVGFGLLYEQEGLIAGFSVPQLLENKLSNLQSDTSDIARQRRHYYALVAGRLELTKAFELEPGFVLRYTAAAPVQAELSLTAVMMKRLRIGTSFRTMTALGIHAGVDVTQRMRVGYAYDVSLGAAAKMPGSHEILMRFAFGNEKSAKSSSRIATPRRVPGI